MGVGAYRRTVRSDELLEELPGGEVGRNGLALPQNVLLPLLLDQHLSRRQEDAVREGNREDVQRVRLSALRKEPSPWGSRRAPPCRRERRSSREEYPYAGEERGDVQNAVVFHELVDEDVLPR